MLVGFHRVFESLIGHAHYNRAKHSTVSSLRPMFKTVSIMPGIENFAPERQDTKSGLFASPNFLPEASSIFFRAASSWSHMPSGNLSPFALYALQASVV